MKYLLYYFALFVTGYLFSFQRVLRVLYICWIKLFLLGQYFADDFYWPVV